MGLASSPVGHLRRPLDSAGPRGSCRRGTGARPLRRMRTVARVRRSQFFRSSSARWPRAGRSRRPGSPGGRAEGRGRLRRAACSRDSCSRYSAHSVRRSSGSRALARRSRTYCSPQESPVHRVCCATSRRADRGVAEKRRSQRIQL